MSELRSLKLREKIIVSGDYKMRKTALLLIIIFYGSIGYCKGGNDPTLDSLITIAIQNNPQLRAARDQTLAE
ncbi:MAG TPA: hypothetical protein VMV32_10740, partial [Ignavibacteriaceae bacterium]|nr:hypothetical protein [Ignavibacteriaceae bacterium]